MAQALEIASLDAPKLAAEIALLKSAFHPRQDAEVTFANSVWFSTQVQIAEELAAKLRGLYEWSWRLWILVAVTPWRLSTGGLIPRLEARFPKL